MLIICYLLEVTMTSRVISNFFKNTQRPIYNPTQISLDVAAWNSLFKVAWGCHEPKCCMYIYYLHCESKLSDHTPVKNINIICKLPNPSGYCASLDRADYIILEAKNYFISSYDFFWFPKIFFTLMRSLLIMSSKNHQSLLKPIYLSYVFRL